MAETASLPEILSSPATALFRTHLEHLSQQSVEKRSEAYVDIDWDAPEMQIHADDPCWEATDSWDPLSHCDWYRDQSPDRRAKIGLDRQMRVLKTAIAFEAAVSEGLLRFTAQLPDRHPAFRYAYHEISEEAQHSLMFQEVINRSGVDPPGSAAIRDTFTRIATDDAVGNILFFIATLASEEAFDYLQRQAMRAPTTHPLVARISRIHISEEARHVSFARSLLRAVVPRLGERQIRALRLEVPLVLGRTAQHMVEAVATGLTASGAPPDVIATVADGVHAQDVRRTSMSRLVALCRELQLVDPRLEAMWRTLEGT